ncbi:MAG: galactose mutarotase [Lachnospiraceae bacterium]|nr:galactose mutarotase [Lachnospiraceae bacterium]
MNIDCKQFGQTTDRKDIFLYTLTNRNGMKVSVSEFGAIITSIIVPDRNGIMGEVVLGYDNVEPYFDNRECFGATIGRSANRIAGASFELDGKTILLLANENGNNLHTDKQNGFHKKLWTSMPDEGRNCVSMTYISSDGENGFPGTLNMKITFLLSDENELSIHYEGMCDKKTLINCTNHSYFNLSGKGGTDILDHYVQIAGTAFTPTGADSIPTGEILPVADTPLDFRRFARVGDRIDSDFEQIQMATGYDHNFVLDLFSAPAASVQDRKSGRCMDVFTDLPGLQFYSGNYIREGLVGHGGAVYGRRCGLCFETQYFPDSVHHKEFRKPIFNPGEKYDTTTVYRFGTCGE